MKISLHILLLSLLSCSLVLAGEEIRDFAPPSIDVPFAKESPSLAAEMNDRAWSGAAEIPDLTLSLGSKSALSPKKTTVRMMWDARYLYIRFVCEADEIVATLVGRDALYHQEDAIEVFLDSVGDGREFFELQVSPNNGVRDVLYLCTAEPKYDGRGMLTREFLARDAWSFDQWTLEGLKTAAHRFNSDGREGWIVDMAIPASVLRRTGQKSFQPMVLRANFLRLEHPRDPANPAARGFISTNWAPVLEGNPHRSPGAFGYLNLTH